jgi:hypothetical protein
MLKAIYNLSLVYMCVWQVTFLTCCRPTNRLVVFGFVTQFCLSVLTHYVLYLLVSFAFTLRQFIYYIISFLFVAHLLWILLFVVLLLLYIAVCTGFSLVHGAIFIFRILVMVAFQWAYCTPS